MSWKLITWMKSRGEFNQAQFATSVATSDIGQFVLETIKSDGSCYPIFVAEISEETALQMRAISIAQSLSNPAPSQSSPTSHPLGNNG